MLCSEFLLVKDGDGYQDVKPLPCDRWSCPYCAPRRRRALIAQAVAGEPNKILTLTINPAIGHSPTDRRRLLHDAWKRLVKRILRRFHWKSLPYMAFIEKTQRGEPHLHILLRCEYIPQSWLSSQMKEMVHSPIVWIEQVKSTAKAIAYVTKYVGKAPAQFGTAKRYWVSRGWLINQPSEPEKPVFDMRGVRVVRERWSEYVQERVAGRFWRQALDDGWVRFWKPGAYGSEGGEVVQLNSS